MWRLANRDPHLIRLGDYLHHLEGKQEVARLLEEEEVGLEELERAFLAEPWKEGLSIVRVVDLTGSTKPFVEVANMAAKDHLNCPFSKLTRIGEEKFVDTDPTRDKPETKVVGLSLMEEDVTLPSYKEWEKREQGNKLRNIFSWKTSNDQTHSVSVVEIY